MVVPLVKSKIYVFLRIFSKKKSHILGKHHCIWMYIDVYLCFFIFVHCFVKFLGYLVVHFVCFLPFWVGVRVVVSCPFRPALVSTLVLCIHFVTSGF